VLQVTEWLYYFTYWIRVGYQSPSKEPQVFTGKKRGSNICRESSEKTNHLREKSAFTLYHAFPAFWFTPSLSTSLGSSLSLSVEKWILYEGTVSFVSRTALFDLRVALCNIQCSEVTVEFILTWAVSDVQLQEWFAQKCDFKPSSFLLQFWLFSSTSMHLETKKHHIYINSHDRWGKREWYLLVQIQILSVWNNLWRYRHASSLQLNTLGLLTIIQLPTA